MSNDTTDTAEHYAQAFETQSSDGPETIDRLLDAVAKKENLTGNVRSLELVIEKIVLATGYDDELRIARALRTIRRICRANSARETREAARRNRGPDMCGND